MALPSCAAVCGRRYSVEHQTTVHPCGAGAAPTVRRTGQSADLRQLSQPKEPGTGVLLRPPPESVLAADGYPDPQPTPAWEDLDAKRAIIIGSGLAVWDVIHTCSIRGASDASIKDVEPNDLAALVNRLGVQAIFCNGATSGRLYRKYAQPLTGLEAVVLPSTSPANAAFTMPRLLDAWGTALEGYVNKP